MSNATEPETRRVVPAWRRLLVAAGWFALFCVVISAAVYFFNRHRLMSQLDRVMKELDESDPGWRWDGLLANRREVKDEENSARRIEPILKAMPRAWPDYKLLEKLGELTPNVALDEPRRKVLDELMAVHPIPRLRVEARGLVRFPRGRIEMVVPENPYAMMLEDHQRIRNIAQILSLDGWTLALAGQHDEALKSAHACLNASRVLEDDPTLIGQLIRIAIGAIAMGMAEKGMALGDASDAALAELQEALKHEAGRTGLVIGMRGERASAHQGLMIASGKMDMRALTGPPSPGGEWWGVRWLMGIANREFARREHAEVLRIMTKIVEAAKLPAKDQFAAEDEIGKWISPTSAGIMVRQLVPAVQKISQAGRRGQCQAAALRALIAVERYRLKHGKWPAKLEDTVPAFLDRVPEDPIDGAPIRYKRWADGVVVYSIGNDRADGGGDVTRFNDFGYRLWDKDKRRAAPPPLPPDEPEGAPGAPGGPP